MKKTFTGGSKTEKFVNVFSLESFALYGTYLLGSIIIITTHRYGEDDSFNVNTCSHFEPKFLQILICQLSESLAIDILIYTKNKEMYRESDQVKSNRISCSEFFT